MKKELEKLLLSEKEYCFEDGTLNKSLVLEKARKYDSKLLSKLMEKSAIKDTFFDKVKNKEKTLNDIYIYIFNLEKFVQFLSNKEFLPDSFTAYKTKIGLASNNKYLSESSDVVLNFPYKDCILEGGQSREDAKREEVFFNRTLAPSEINRLLDDKVFTNFKIINKDGENEVTEITDKDNFIIKGNNLVVLHSLKKRFAGKIKCIYIDPPYNTGNDSFKYNDKFNHSTWLTFMKNRLEVARELLADDGVIFVHCDDNEQAYLKVLMDEVFGRENFIINLIWANKEGGGKSDSLHFRKKHEYIISYGKNKTNVVIHPEPVKDIDRYKEEDEYVNTRGKHQLIKLDSGSLGWVKSLDYPIEHNGIMYYAGGDKSKWEDRAAGGSQITEYGWRWRWSKEKFQWGLENDFIVFKNGNVYTKQYLNCDNEGNIKPRTLQPLGMIEHSSNTQSNRHIKSLFGTAKFTYSKPESIIKDIIFYATQPNDLVLDFHLGSGTTAAVAHKMGRRYIGIEQMDYIEDIAVERLKKVIDGEQGGISKAVEWQGGGDFIYCELKNDAQDFVDIVEKSTSDEELVSLLEKLKHSSFLSYRVDSKKLNTKEFEKLSLYDKKQLLLEVIDSNMLYLNYSDINDTSYNISDLDKKLNKEFYDGGNE